MGGGGEQDSGSFPVVCQRLASTTGFIELLSSPKQPVKDKRDVVSDWLPIFNPEQKMLHPGH